MEHGQDSAGRGQDLEFRQNLTTIPGPHSPVVGHLGMHPIRLSGVYPGARGQMSHSELQLLPTLGGMKHWPVDLPAAAQVRVALPIS